MRPYARDGRRVCGPCDLCGHGLGAVNTELQILINTGAIAVLTALLAFIAAAYWNNRRRAEKRDEELNDLKRQMAILQIPVQQMNAAFQAMLVKQLTHFHTKELDQLLAKLGPPMVLTAAESDRLTTLLLQREHDLNDQIDDSERDAAHMLPMVMKRVKEEMSQAHEMKDLVLVAVPKSSDVKSEHH